MMCEDEVYECESSIPPYLEYYHDNKDQIISWFLEKMKVDVLKIDLEDFLNINEDSFDQFKRDCYNDACDEINFENSLFKAL